MSRIQLYLVAALVAIAAIGTAYLKGRSDGAGLQRAAQAKVDQRAAAAARRIARAANVIDQRLAAAQGAQRAEIREIVREVPTVVQRPVYRNVCIDDAGVQLLERAVAAANGDAVGRADGAGAEGGTDPGRN